MMHSPNSPASSRFMLGDLIRKERLLLYSEAANMGTVFDLLLPKDEAGRIECPIMVGIDGSVTAGKSFLATALYEYLIEKKASCVVVHGDWFMVSRAQRKQEIEKAAKGGYCISDYDAVACDFAALGRVQKRIHGFLQSGKPDDTLTIPNAYNRDTGESDKTIQLGLRDISVVIVEGTGVLSAEAQHVFDLSIRVDVRTYDETVKRLFEREAEKLPAQRLDQQFIRERYDLIDYPYDQYLRARDSSYFDFLLDTSEPSSMKLYDRA